LPDLFTTKSICTHELPNKLQIIEPDYKFQIAGDSYLVEVTLLDDNTCHGTADGVDFDESGCNWTMMYDQAFII
jgi:hypothetical protein